MQLTVPEAIAQIRQGHLIILVDDEDRENEGDLCLAAEKVTPDAINFMARFGRGLICLTMTETRLRHLGLTPMADRNRSRFGTNFYTSIEAREGVTTGISAADRSRTIEVAVSQNAGADDVVTPGHVFPIGAVEGGVLVRCGQTEGSVDLAREAGLAAAGVICEIMKDDGTMARRADLERFAEAHGLGILSVAQLIEYRLQRERQIKCVSEQKWTRNGQLPVTMRTYHSSVSDVRYIAILIGSSENAVPIVRMHRAHLIDDVFGGFLDWNAQHAIAQRALKRIDDAGGGIFVYILPRDLAIDESQLSGGVQTKKNIQGSDNRPARRYDVSLETGATPELREFGLGAQVLKDLGLTRIRLLTDHPRPIAGLSGYDLEVVETIPLT